MAAYENLIVANCTVFKSYFSNPAEENPSRQSGQGKEFSANQKNNAAMLDSGSNHGVFQTNIKHLQAILWLCSAECHAAIFLSRIDVDISGEQ